MGGDSLAEQHRCRQIGQAGTRGEIRDQQLRSGGQRSECRTHRRLVQPLSTWPRVSKPMTTPLALRSSKHLHR